MTQYNLHMSKPVMQREMYQMRRHVQSLAASINRLLEHINELPNPPRIPAAALKEIAGSRRAPKDDPWQDNVLWWCLHPTGNPARSIAGERVYISEILEHQYGYAPGTATHAEKARVGAILRQAGWRKRREGYKRDGSPRLEYWIPPIGGV